MIVALIEPYYTSSHKSWADGIVKYSQHSIQLFTLPGRHWKWRMHGAAISFADQVNEMSIPPDLIVVSDMIDLAVFRALLKQHLKSVPVLLYMHENQITYPWSLDDPDVRQKRNNHYGWINYTSALVADHIAFNSEFHIRSFIESLPEFLDQFPDKSPSSKVTEITDKSSVVSVGLELKDEFTQVDLQKPTFLWNHRWEFDKNPESFFQLMFRLKYEGYDFDLVVFGESYNKEPKIFAEAKQLLSAEIVHWGFENDGERYHKLLMANMIYPVTSNQDFFGISSLEAIYYGAYPLLPNRLAFPEHFRALNAKKHYYDTDEELYHKVCQIIKTESWKSDPQLRSAIERYKWKNLIECYDRCFLLMVKAKIPNKVANIATLKP